MAKKDQEVLDQDQVEEKEVQDEESQDDAALAAQAEAEAKAEAEKDGSDTEHRPNPKSLVIRLVGTREQLSLNDVTVAALTDDGKLNRNSVFQIGRISNDPDRYEFFADGGDQPVVVLHRAAQKWTLKFDNGKTKVVDRSSTKKPGAAGKRGELDTGPDLYKATTAAMNFLYPDLKQVATGRTGAASAKLQQEISEKNAQIATLVKVVLERLGTENLDPQIAAMIAAMGGGAPAPAPATEGEGEKEPAK